MLSIDAWLDERPYKEVFDHAIHEKVSLQRTHGMVAGRLCTMLAAWAAAHGDVAVEWRVYLAEGVTLVPDVAFISRARLAPLARREREMPPFAPDIAVEVRSPEDSERRIRRKTKLYLRYGATLVLNVDPGTRSIAVESARETRSFAAGSVVAPEEFPGLAIDVAAVFAGLDA
ncbi:MAG: Uma2 family endonuclease [Vulcanimicrobiaceae bacterium]